MSTIQIPNKGKSAQVNDSVFKSLGSKIIQKYKTYINTQQDQKVYWYMKVIIIIPCVYMVLSIMAMSQLIENFEYYVGFCMLLFFANVIIHIAELKSRIFIPFYYFSLMLFILIPLITYLIG